MFSPTPTRLPDTPHDAGYSFLFPYLKLQTRPSAPSVWADLSMYVITLQKDSDK